MKALILAAGVGSRLRPLTEVMPKSMVPINGKPILFKQLDNLLAVGVEDITIVVGYKADFIISKIKENYPTVTIIVNDVFDKTNNMYSAYLAKSKLYGEDFFLMNADVYFDASVLNEMISEKYQNSIVVEENGYNEESMKVKVSNGNITDISKQIVEMDAYGVSIDVYKFNSEGSKAMFDRMRYYIEVENNLNSWTEVALNDILKTDKFEPCPLKGRWMEIDNHEDLKQAERIFNDEK